MLMQPQYFTNIEQKNTYKKNFDIAYSSKDYKKAILNFNILESTTRIIEPELRINAAQSYFIIGDTLNARKNYEILKDIPDETQSALTSNQLGVLAAMNKDSSLSLKYFKNAIEKKNDFEIARYNYELINKLWHSKNRNSPQNNNQSKVPNSQVIASNLKEDKLDEYKSKKISKEKALQILEDLKNSEQSYFATYKKSLKKNEKDW